jgi:hypothetical protein
MSVTAIDDKFLVVKDVSLNSKLLLVVKNVSFKSTCTLTRGM